MFNSKDNGDKPEETDVQETGTVSETTARDIKEGRLCSFIGNGTSLNGELSFNSMAQINGHLSGKVTSEKGTLIIGASGQVDAVVSVATGIINGTVNGDIIASEHLELKSTAKIVGNIRTPRLIMEDGAVLEGKCSMLKVEEKAEIRNIKQSVPPSVPATTTAAAVPRSNFVPVGDNQLKDKKPAVPERKNEELPNLTLDVI